MGPPPCAASVRGSQARGRCSCRAWRATGWEWWSDDWSGLGRSAVVKEEKLGGGAIGPCSTLAPVGAVVPAISISTSERVSLRVCTVVCGTGRLGCSARQLSWWVSGLKVVAYLGPGAWDAVASSGVRRTLGRRKSGWAIQRREGGQEGTVKDRREAATEGGGKYPEEGIRIRRRGGCCVGVQRACRPRVGKIPSRV